MTKPEDNRVRIVGEQIMAVRTHIPESETSSAGDPGYESDGLALEPDSEAGKNAVYMKLANTIEGEIIPRLLLAHQWGAEVSDAAAGNAFSSTDVNRFAEMTYARNGSLTYAFLKNARANGTSLESIIMDLLAPAAAYLGEAWKVDACTFTEVTVGLSRLRQILRELSRELEMEATGWRHGRRALLLPAPGEQHTFGIFVVEAFFRRAGWDVFGDSVESLESVAKLVQNQWFAIAGLSLSSERHLDKLVSLVKTIRLASTNQGIGILVGGSLFLEKPELVSYVGADGGATDGRNAVIQARDFLSRAALRH